MRKFNVYEDVDADVHGAHHSLVPPSACATIGGTALQNVEHADDDEDDNGDDLRYKF